MSRPKRILLLSLKAGAGHIRAADAIREALSAHGGECEVRHLEVLEYMTGLFRWSFSTFYSSMLRIAPFAWRMLYERSERQATSALKSAIGAVNRLNARRLFKAVQSFDPDCIVCTHFIPAGLLAALRRRNTLRARLCVVVTDYDLHGAWVHRGVDQYCVATEEMVRSLQDIGIDGAKVSAPGIPIFSAFRQEYPERRVMRERLKMNPALTTVLLTSGGCGLGQLNEMAALLLQHFPDTQFVAVAGKNEKLHAALQKLAANSDRRLLPLGFVQNMHEVMAACDLVISKPGGLTSSECLAMGLPMILIDPIPGQEERNANFLLENGAALRAQHKPNLIHKVKMVLADRSRLARMSSSGRAAGKPTAAVDVSEIALDLAGEAATDMASINVAHLDPLTPKALAGGLGGQGGHVCSMTNGK